MKRGIKESGVGIELTNQEFYLGILEAEWIKQGAMKEKSQMKEKASRNQAMLLLATIVEGNPKAPFSIATTPRCRGGR